MKFKPKEIRSLRGLLIRKEAATRINANAFFDLNKVEGGIKQINTDFLRIRGEGRTSTQTSFFTQPACKS
jgi:hypothetical protein